jgi:16S rRNA processing protein RimM
MSRARICIGAIAGAHGVKGLVKIKSFTEKPKDVAAYDTLGDETGDRRYDIAVVGSSRDLVIARVEGVEDREAAQALRGTRLYVDRSALPATEEETYYHADLIGLDAVGVDGAAIGTVKAVHNYGAGDVIEIERRDEEPLLVSFTRSAVPEVDLTVGRLVVREPEES